MEAAAIYVPVMTNKHAKRRYMLSGPQSSNFVMSSAEEVMAIRTPSNVPNRRIMTSVYHEAAPSIHAPKPNRLVSRR
jgi:hypothetical protein